MSIIEVDNRTNTITYNTKGTGHRTNRCDYDYMYNRGYSWNSLFDGMVKDALSKAPRIGYSTHIKSYDKTGNRTFDIKKEITLEALKKGEVVEIETEINDYCDTDIETLRKAVIRLPARPDGEQVVAVCGFGYRGDVFIRTAWLNKANDNHQTGLDTSEFSLAENKRFGFFYGRWNSQAYEVGSWTEVKRLDDDKMITAEEWMRRNNR